MQQTPVYSVYDLIANDSFKKWILFQDQKEGQYWHDWLSENPDKLEWVAVAKSMVLLLNSHTNTVSAGEVDDAAAAIMSRLDDDHSVIEADVPSMWSRAGTWRAAAVLLLMVSGIIYFLIYAFRAKDYEGLPAFNNKLVFENSRDSALPVTLPDGSRVFLEKGSRLQYADDDSLKQRVAILYGNAFFDIAHNPSHPFVVYTNTIVTRVLGTSFQVKATPGNATFSVIVKTGKVSVFRKKDFFQRDPQSGNPEGVVLGANQQVSYDISHDRLRKTLVADPFVLSSHPNTTLHIYGKPAGTVFKQLEEMYGIPVIIDEKTLSGCSVTVVLGNENFYEKLKALCTLIHASYEIIDGTIVINSKGC